MVFHNPFKKTTTSLILHLFSTIYRIIFQVLKSTFADLLECGEKEIGRKEKPPYPGKIRWFSYPSNKKATEKTSLPPLSG